MKIKPEILACLIQLSNYDLAQDSVHSNESFAATLSKYIDKYTKGKKLPVPIRLRYSPYKERDLYNCYVEKIKSYEE